MLNVLSCYLLWSFVKFCDDPFEKSFSIRDVMRLGCLRFPLKGSRIIYSSELRFNYSFKILLSLDLSDIVIKRFLFHENL